MKFVARERTIAGSFGRRASCSFGACVRACACVRVTWKINVDVLHESGGGAHTIVQLQMRSSSQILQRVAGSSFGGGGSGGGGSDGGGGGGDGTRAGSAWQPSPRSSRSAAASAASSTGADGGGGGGGGEVRRRRSNASSTAASRGDEEEEEEEEEDAYDDVVAVEDINFMFSLCRHGHIADVRELVDAGYPVDTVHPQTGNTLGIVVRTLRHRYAHAHMHAC